MGARIPIQSYTYTLPAERIAQTAAEPRDSSKLLLYREGDISHHVFRDIHQLLPEDSHLVFNNARVIQARLLLSNRNGAGIEVFLLQPWQCDYSAALEADAVCRWQCLVGNSKKWKMDEVLYLDAGSTRISVKRIDAGAVEFSWDGGRHFSELLEHAGLIPLPPYIRHEADEYDRERYQTVFSSVSGSVAAPTAGLHFTRDVLENLETRGIPSDFVTLHVGAGTFMPVKTDDAREHPMHREFFSVSRRAIENLRQAVRLIPVGTTACRVLESLYWIAVNIAEKREAPLSVAQFDYEHRTVEPGPEQAVKILLDFMDANRLEVLEAETSIMLAPPYSFRMCSGLITNFHQPGSTLLLLIAALLGEDWKQVYRAALDNDYRFLSYGDSSLLLPKRIF